MSNRYISVLSLLALALIFAVVLSCSDNSTDPVGPDPQPQAVDTLDVSPSTGMAGSVVSVTGLDFAEVDTSTCLFTLGGESAPFVLSPDGHISVALPLFLDSTGWSAPPSEGMPLELWVDDSLAAVSRTDIVVTTLERADGTLDSIRSDIEAATLSIEALLTDLPVYDDRERAVRQGIVSMLTEPLISGDSSLAAILDGSSSLWQGGDPDLALLDAILAATGANGFFEAYADGLASLRDSVSTLAAKRATSIYCSGESAPDMDLACQMQIFVLMDAFTRQFVIPTASAYNNTVGLAAGLAAISGVGTVPGIVAEIIGALLTIESFVMEKLVIAVLPSDIVAFQMALEKDTIGIDELTNSNIVITAANRPTPITVNDVVTTILAAMPFLDLPSTERFGEVLLRAAQFVIDQYRNILLEYEQANPGSFTDPELTSIPYMLYGPVYITHYELAEVFTLNPEIVEPVDTALDWRGLTKGVATVRAETRNAGSMAKVVRDWLFFTAYTGGAFGEELASTPNHQVVVAADGELIVGIEGLPEGTSGSVEVTGPNSFSAGLTQTDTLTDLSPGDYIVRGHSVTVDGIQYTAQPEVQTVTVYDKETSTATVTYNSAYGTIYLTITGLTTDIEADVTVSGPSTNIHVTGESFYSGTYRNRLDSLPPGEYTITANNVSDADGVSYTPVPASQDVTVASDSTSNAEVDYQAPVFLRLLAGSRSEGECLSLSYSSAAQRHDYWSPTFNSDTLADTACTPDYAGYPYYYYSDSCGEYFDTGRREITGAETHNTQASAGSASSDLLFTVQAQENRMCRFEWQGEVSASLPGAGADEIWSVASRARSTASFDSASHPLYYIEIENTGNSDAFMSRSYSMELIESGGSGAYWSFAFCDKYLRCPDNGWYTGNCFLNANSATNGDTLISAYDGSTSFSARIPGKTTIRMAVNFELLLQAGASYDHRNPNGAIQGGQSTIQGYIEYFIKRQED